MYITKNVQISLLLNYRGIHTFGDKGTVTQLVPVDHVVKFASPATPPGGFP